MLLALCDFSSLPCARSEMTVPAEKYPEKLALEPERKDPQVAHMYFIFYNTAVSRVRVSYRTYLTGLQFFILRLETIF